MNELRRRMANWTYFVAAWGLLTGTFVMSILSFLFPEFVEKYVLQLSSLTTLLCIMLPTMILISTKSGQVFAKRFHIKSIKSSTFMIIPMAISGFFAFTGLNGIVSCIFALCGVTPVNTAAQTAGNATSSAALMIMGSLLPGIIEESLFRGVLLPAYEDKGGFKAVLISAVLFATLHGDPIALTAQFGLGILLGYIALRARSVYPGMIYHAIHNGITFIVLLAEQASGAAQAADTFSAENLPMLMLSSGAMLVAGAAALALCIVIFHILTKNEHKKAEAEQAFAPMEFNDDQKKVKRVYLPLVLGAVAAVIINVMGIVSLGMV